MKLTIADRLYIINGLTPSKGSMMTMMVVKDIQKKVEIGQAEVAAIELRDNEGGGLVWNREKATEKEVEFTDSEAKVMKDHIDKLSKEENIPMAWLDTCKKFV